MRYLWALALTLGVLGFATPTFAQTGTCSSDNATTLTDTDCTEGDWTLDAGVGPCCNVGPAADPTNLYIIDNRVIIDDDLTFTTGGLDPGAGVLSFEPDNNGNFTVDLNDGNLFFDTDAIPNFELALRAFNDLATVGSDPTDRDYHWTVPKIILCPGAAVGPSGEWTSDCAGALAVPGSVNQIMFLWESTKYDIDASVAAVGVGDLIQFYWTEDMGGPAGVSMEHAQMYEIVATSGAGDHNGDDYIIIDVRQTNTTTPDVGDTDWPPTERAIQIIQTTADASQGQRLGIQIASSTYLAADADEEVRGGVCMYPGGSFDARDPLQPALVSDWFEDADGAGAGTDDLVSIAPLEGLGDDIASGTDLYFTPPCIRPGDRFIVIAPTRFYSSSASDLDALIQFHNTDGLVVQGVLFDDVGQVGITSQDGGTVTFRHVWARDLFGEAANGMIGATSNMADGPDYDLDFDYVTITGGHEDAVNCPTGCHGIQHFDYNTSHTGSAFIEDYATRYLTDDYYFCKGANTNNICRVFAKRWNLGPMSNVDGCSTMSVVEGGSGASVIEMSDAVCRNCMTDQCAESFIISTSSPSLVSLRKATFINSTQNGSWPCWSGNTTTDGCQANDIMAVGIKGQFIVASGAGTHTQYLKDFVIRDARSSFGTLTANLDAPRTINLQNGIIHQLVCGGSSAGTTFGANPTTGTFYAENILWRYQRFLATACDGAFVTSCLRWNPGGGAGFSNTFKNITWTSDSHSAEAPCTSVFETDGVATYEGLTADSNAFVYNHVGAATALETDVESRAEATWLGNWCFEHNIDGDGDTGANEDYNVIGPGSTAVELLPLDLEDPTGQLDGTGYHVNFPNYAPQPGGLADRSACGIYSGARAPGVRTDGWYLWATGLHPEFQGSPGGHKENAW